MMNRAMPQSPRPKGIQLGFHTNRFPQLNHNIWQTTLQHCPPVFVINPWQQQKITNQSFRLCWQGAEFSKDTAMTIPCSQVDQLLLKRMGGMNLIQPFQRQHPQIRSRDVASPQIGQRRERCNELR
jgi:hypothetical protein